MSVQCLDSFHSLSLSLDLEVAYMLQEATSRTQVNTDANGVALFDSTVYTASSLRVFQFLYWKLDSFLVKKKCSYNKTLKPLL